MKSVTEQTVRQWHNYLTNVLKSKPKIQGYALPQDNVNVSAFIIRNKGDIIFMANPEILCRLGIWHSLEGCESVEGHYKVWRPLVVRVKYIDEKWEEHKRWFLYKRSRIICHEYDHLRDKTIADVGKRWRGDKYIGRFK